jgi:cation transport regulator ChaC
MLHFAYGSNMDRRLMRRHCPGARPVGRAVLRDHRFIITKDGYASVVAARGEVVHGLLWRITPRDLAALNAYENIESGLYRAAHLSVRAGGRAVRALVYLGRSGVPGRPRLGYMELVAAAAREAGLPADYVANLERIWDMPSRSAVAPNGETGGRRGGIEPAPCQIEQSFQGDDRVGSERTIRKL